jgi:hypothetical protein
VLVNDRTVALVMFILHEAATYGPRLSAGANPRRRARADRRRGGDGALTADQVEYGEPIAVAHDLVPHIAKLLTVMAALGRSGRRRPS